MKSRRKLLLLSITVAGVVIATAGLVRLLNTPEPTYQGKTVSAWFKEYKTPNTWNPAATGLRALGSNAVPYLVRQVSPSFTDRPLYIRVFTNLPPVIKRRLPNPWTRQFNRYRAVSALAGLGEQARPASPVLLSLLRKPDSVLPRRETAGALRSLRLAQTEIDQVTLEFGRKGQYADALEIAGLTGWEQPDVARLLGRILRAPDPKLRQEAIRLLERDGVSAVPALAEITEALADSDGEVRYFAVRSIETLQREGIITNNPAVISALRRGLNDEKVTVRNVSRRTLLRIDPNEIPLADSADAREKN